MEGGGGTSDGPSDSGGGGMDQAAAEAAMNAVLSGLISAEDISDFTNVVAETTPAREVATVPSTYTSPGAKDQALADFENTLAAQDRGMSLAELAAAVQGMTLADKASVDLAGIGGQREHSPGLSYSDLAALAQAGLGKMDIPGFNQNVEQALAAQNVHNVLNYAAPAIASLVPGYGMVSALGKGIAGIHGLMSGRLTAEQVVPSIAAGLIGAKTGIPSGILEGIFTGDLGKTVGSGAQAGLGALVGGLTGNPAIGGLASATLGPAVGKAASDAVGGSKSGGLSSALGNVAPSSSQAPTGNVYGDTSAANATEALLAELAPKQETQQPPAWTPQIIAGRYGPTVQYDFGA